MDYRIKPHAPPFDKIPANSVEFQPCDCTTQVWYFMLTNNILNILNTHFLQYRLIGFRILFAPYTFIHKIYFNKHITSVIENKYIIYAFYRYYIPKINFIKIFKKN